MGEAGFGGIFHDFEGVPLLILYGSIGWDTEKSTEVEGLIQGLKISQENDLFPIEVEDDSRIIINVAKHILYVSSSSKI